MYYVHERTIRHERATGRAELTARAAAPIRARSRDRRVAIVRTDTNGRNGGLQLTPAAQAAGTRGFNLKDKYT